MDRRELFGSLFSSQKKEKKNLVLRPPYYIDESSFDKECITCDGVCSTFCQENIIIIGEDKTPYISFENSGCTYCDECAIACPKEVLNVENKKHINIKIEIDMLKCLSWNNTMCFSCKDPCLDDAIEFLGIFKPSILEDKCTSCGFCVSTCPSDAIILKEI